MGGVGEVRPIIRMDRVGKVSFNLVDKGVVRCISTATRIFISNKIFVKNPTLKQLQFQVGSGVGGD